MPTAQQRKLARLAKALPDVSEATRRKALQVLADADEAEDGADLDDVRVQKELLDLCLTELKRQKVKIDFLQLLVVADIFYDGEFDVPKLEKAHAKATKLASAVERAGKAPDLNAIAKLRPKKARLDEHTFPSAAAKTVVGAWSRFDRRKFAARLFGGLDELHLYNAGAIDDLTGLDAAQSIVDLALIVTRDCELGPIGKLRGLRELKLSGRANGFGALAQLPALWGLDIIELTGDMGPPVDDLGLRELATIASVEHLNLSVGPTVDLAPLVDLPRLTFLSLGSGGRKLDAAATEVFRRLYERGVYLNLYRHDAWTAELTVPIGQTRPKDAP